MLHTVKEKKRLVVMSIMEMWLDIIEMMEFDLIFSINGALLLHLCYERCLEEFVWAYSQGGDSVPTLESYCVVMFRWWYNPT